MKNATVTSNRSQPSHLMGKSRRQLDLEQAGYLVSSRDLQKKKGEQGRFMISKDSFVMVGDNLSLLVLDAHRLVFPTKDSQA